VKKRNSKEIDLKVCPGATGFEAGWPMIKKYFKRLIIANKEAILTEVLSVKGLMQLLMKTRNTDAKWTREEKKEIRMHLKNISKIIPIVALFSLPGGSILLPILAEVLDRRKTRRLSGEKIQG
jgi:hypothetical protein